MVGVLDTRQRQRDPGCVGPDDPDGLPACTVRPGWRCVRVGDETTCVQSCGDGVVDVDEECDEGPNNMDGDPARCRTNCTLPRCGDGIIDTGGDGTLDEAAVDDMVGIDSDGNDTIDFYIDAYEAARSRDLSARARVIDLYNRVCRSDAPPVQALRSLGLQLAHDVAPLRRTIMRAGMGPASVRQSAPDDARR